MAETVETRERLLLEMREALAALTEYVRSEYATDEEKWQYPTRVGEHAAQAALDHVAYSQLGTGMAFQRVALVSAVDRLLEQVAGTWQPRQ